MIHANAAVVVNLSYVAEQQAHKIWLEAASASRPGRPPLSALIFMRVTGLCFLI